MNKTDYRKIEATYGCPIDWEQSRIITANDVVSYLHQRPYNSHKGTFGHAMLIAGKRGMAGAAILSARAALRAGVGLLTVHTPTYNTPIIQSAVPEAIISEDDSSTHFSHAPNTTKYDAIAIGPGLGISEESAQAFTELLEKETRPLIIDADALNLIGAHPELLSMVPANSIITPHYRELQRIASKEFALNERLDIARKLAGTYQLYIIVKGAYTAIVCPDQHILFNTTGNAGMATAGSGDVLTGILAALLAQNYTPYEACILSTFIHGLSGDISASEIGEISMISSDIIQKLSQAFKTLNEQKYKKEDKG